VDAAQSPYSTILKSGFATHHRFTWHFLADWVLKNNRKLLGQLEKACGRFISRTRVREALEAAAARHHRPGASDGGDGGDGAGERTGQRRGPQGDLRALPRLNGL
jgi:hypothetical protein